jgi:hypothetical protein
LHPTPGDGAEWSPRRSRRASSSSRRSASSSFATQTGRIAAIGALSDACAILAGAAGTRIVREHSADRTLSPAAP